MTSLAEEEGLLLLGGERLKEATLGEGVEDELVIEGRFLLVAFVHIFVDLLLIRTGLHFDELFFDIALELDMKRWFTSTSTFWTTSSDSYSPLLVLFFCWSS